ncbi:restriction endonuclease [Pelobium manganitolerans]|uniref:Restriction endonuclease n=1 Tax=Pelobium manganitolerans TaxID=1842495 RepID=A0A419S494_9SPHI|nr:Uma2 family endonuclease [Pelobium manganitolerans]RKD14432.1 restriction endonuclease [Pelobium manganitolerans]
MEQKKYIVEEEPVYTLNELDESLTYSYANYLNWLFDERLELIKGKIFKMSPAPSRYHQKILSNLFREVGNFLYKQPCEVYVAPFDVRFPTGSKTDSEIFTVLQPDLCVICDKTKLDDRGCLGAPDLVVEILSPGNNKKELLLKYQLYEEFGVKEYWVVSPSEQTLLIYSLDEDGKYRASKLLTLSEKAESKVLRGFKLDVDLLFED